MNFRRWFNGRLFKRWWRFWLQRRWRGWDDSDTWCLDGMIAKFALPRLRRFRELNNGFPNGTTEESWDAEIGEMIYALEVCEEELDGIPTVDWERVQRGLDAFGSRFRDLWW